MSELLDKMKAYGVDIETTMARFVDDEELYSACLAEFTQDGSFDKLKKAIDDEDFGTAFEIAHMLKGVSGNLGLTPLYTAICALVESLRHGSFENADALYQAVAQEYKRAYTAITA